ncbi:Inner membrane protein YjjP [Providencia rustigianii]|nr:Inner membrane protein YjjP [Providencia rustigianii]
MKDSVVDQHIEDKSVDVQREITKLCIECGLLLLQHGAESMLVEQLTTRLGIALGANQVDSAISSNSLVLTTIVDGRCLTSTRRIIDRGINMHVVTEVQHAVILVEHHLLDRQQLRKKLNGIKPLRYPRWLMVLMVALSCACFSSLNGGGLESAFITFFSEWLRNVYSSGFDIKSNKSTDQFLYYRICCDFGIGFITKNSLF